MIAKSLKDIVIPAKELVLAQAKKEPILFPQAQIITEDWIKQSQTYQYLFGIVLIKQTGLDRLEERIAQRNIRPASEDQKNYYQKFDCIGLKYFYLRGCARIERLSNDDRNILQAVSELQDQESNIWTEALEMVKKTFYIVMTVNPDEPKTVFEPQQTLHGDYRVRGNAIPFALRSVAVFDADGALESEDAEKERLTIMTNVWKQIDNVLSETLGCATNTSVEVFLL